MSAVGARMLAAVALCVMLAWQAQAAQVVFETATPSDDYPISRTVQFRLTVHNPANRSVADAQVWAYAPVRLTAFQQCRRIETSHAAALSTDTLGNQILQFSLGTLPPNGTKVVTVRAHLGMSNEASAVPQFAVTPFLLPDPLIESAHPEIVALAAQPWVKDAPDPARRLHDWVTRNVEYTGYLREDRGALYALRERKGDCTEYTSLFVALCRASGLPARSVAGYVMDSDGLLNANDFHSWAEFQEEGIWQVSDPQAGRFKDRPSQYVATRILGGPQGGPLDGAHRFRCEPAELDVRWN